MSTVATDHLDCNITDKAQANAFGDRKRQRHRDRRNDSWRTFRYVAIKVVSGTDELAEVTSQALLGRSAVIMKNHGSLTTAETLDQALGRCVTLEWCSKVYLKALSIGSPNVLSDDEMALAKMQMDYFEEKRRAFKRG